LADAHARNRELALSVGNARALLAQHGFQHTPEDALDVMVARAVDAARYPAQVGWENERQPVRTLHKWAMQASDRGELYAGLVFETRALYAAHALGEQVSVPTRCILAKSVRGFAEAIMAMEHGRPTANALEPEDSPSALDAPFIDQKVRWSLDTFGPGERTAGVCAHLRKEITEAERDPRDAREWADILLLAFDGAGRVGIDGAALIAAVRAKDAENRTRRWPDWRTLPADAPIEHVSTPDAGAAEAARCGDCDGCMVGAPCNRQGITRAVAQEVDRG
jgi:hypothetical protein